MQYVEGCKMKDYLQKSQNIQPVLEEIGSIIALLHNGSIIHGDLTTSNFMVKKDEQNISSDQKDVSEIAIIVNKYQYFMLFSISLILD
jgi:tRNA A-37 threonylcarbamoyl transferase component Bud32